ncbi:hypothetical protein HU718_016765 [Pseudomonas tensinigenes]|uniref:HNH endonuclease n=1 Tax=Pseudomonas tensinigenes TaxID=2745511 RepID=A0ABX8PR86_9PSED|nr:hypothetical protein [Pseudomonas tensinigenes]QXI03688.1 hypothetical protein HU718_016765 [Pseudomonas tensinigenes]
MDAHKIDTLKLEAERIALERFGATSSAEIESILAVLSYEQTLLQKHGKRQPAAYTWRMLEKHGIVSGVERVVIREAETQGYRALLSLGLQDFAFEAVVVRHPEIFSPEAVEHSASRLRDFEDTLTAGYKFWWVNHKQTFKAEFDGGYIWSPKTNKNGARNKTYENLTQVEPGDVVVSYANGRIKAIGIAINNCAEAPKPEEFGSIGASWAATGFLVSINWIALSTPISPKAHIDKILKLLPKKNSPLQSSGNGNQGCYLAAISVALGYVIFSLLGAPDFEAIIAKQALVSADGTGLAGSARLPAEELRKVTAEYIWKAVQYLLQGALPEDFGPSIDYDLLVDANVRLAPKQVFGLAASEALKFKVMPKHFTAGKGTVCFELLEAAGYKIIAKGDPIELIDVPIDAEVQEWAEGQLKLVTHLRRERSPGLAKAKKADFIKAHGGLFCERCGLDPVETYGEQGEACIEVHHDSVKVADMGEDHKTTLDQLLCLCANCHRVLHRELKASSVHSASGYDRSGGMSPVLS